MFSLLHPQTDESFLDTESTVEDVIRLLQSLQKPKEEGEEEAEAPKEDLRGESVTEDNFMVTERQKPLAPKKVPIPILKSKKKKADPSDGNKDRFTFMRQVDVDHEESSKARLERERVAQNFRKLGNSEYRQGNYLTAMRMFSKAIENINDSHILYINRALCFIKSGRFKRAIVDCDYVLNKLDEKNLRAWLYRAMAYKGLNDESNFENCVKYARKFNSKQMEFIDGFLEKLK
ncbi:sperm-associated antigen 1A [Drosophila pseudoobscura]|uniref:Sperm-associated antigen 1A n=1 Tax=Drosophila pseudoobscura pseudoobscura TaxID=46245 RepID=A0A6I8V319_DROPS|nr:sperm-associated antigen 1A [Drosophila pseudoobscura]